MYRIDTSTAASSKPAYPAAGTEKYFQDTDPSGGTIVPAWFLNQIQEEIRKVITDAGLTPDKANDGQLSAAVSILAANTPYLHVNYETSAASDSEFMTLGAWRTRPLNTVKTNTISGASLSSNKITLPAGTYRAEGKMIGFDCSRWQSRIRKVSGTEATLIVGTTQYNYAVASPNPYSTSIANGVFVLTESSDIEFQYQSSATQDLAHPADFGEANVWCIIEIWKIA